MASAVRTLRMASRMALPRPAAASLRATPIFTQRAFLSGSTAPRKSEVIKETEIPVSVYTPDAKNVGSGSSSASDHTTTTLPVKRGAQNPEPVAPEEPMQVVKPLAAEVYAKMPATMQKMSVMGKVIIITG